MKRLLIVLLVFCLCLCMAVPVLADSEETQSGEIDWETVDWSTFDWKLLNEGNNEDSLSAWIYDEAELHDVFLVQTYSTAASLYIIGTRIWREFSAAPEMFLRVLALEEKNVQERVISAVVYSLDAEPQEVVAVLETVTLSDTDSAATYALLREMISFAESAYQVKINNPKTADPLTAVLFLLPLSTAGLAVLFRRRKYVA